jgi:two-component system response regulator AtoC
MSRILVVDDDESVRKLLTVVLGKEGFDVTCADNGLTGLDAFRKTSPDIVIMDIRMPEMDGLKALEEIGKLRRGAAVILMTAYAAVETAVQAMKLGAFDYVIKPFDIDEVLLLIERALQMRQMRNDINLLHRELLQSYRLDRILTDNARMKELCLTVTRIAESQRADHRGKRLRKRTGRVGDPLQQQAPERSVRQDQLRGHPRGAPGERIFRT